MAEYRYAAWVQWMNEVYYKPQPVPGYPNFKADRAGNVYKNDALVKPFKSNGYQQVCLNGTRKNKVVKGVHQVIAMTFDERYYDGCHVHHKDENKQNNNISNLDVEDPHDHIRHHANPEHLKKYIAEHGSPNKGKKMSPEFCEKCRISAIKRCERERLEKSK